MSWDNTKNLYLPNSVRSKSQSWERQTGSQRVNDIDKSCARIRHILIITLGISCHSRCRMAPECLWFFSVTCLGHSYKPFIFFCDSLLNAGPLTTRNPITTTPGGIPVPPFHSSILFSPSMLLSLGYS